MRKLIMDVDTGSDDAIAMLVALLSAEEFEVLGICPVNGNLPLKNVIDNTLRVVDVCGVGDRIPVIPGCNTPMVATLDPNRPKRRRSHQGTDEDGNPITYHTPQLPLPDPISKPLDDHAPIWYVHTLMNQTEKVIIALLGPMTNLAMALRIEPRISEHIEEIVFMGGAHGNNNCTPAAEFNIFTDPEAAQIVFTSGIKLTMMPLDATYKANFRPRHIDFFKAWNTQVGDFLSAEVASRIKAYNIMQPLHEPDIAPFHDALTIAYLIDPTVITSIKHMRVDVDCSGGRADGRTICDTRYRPDEEKNVYVCFDVDEEKYVNLLVSILDRTNHRE